MIVAKKSLFDLIQSNESEKQTHSIYLNEKEYIATIVSDIEKLLNTRCIFPKSKRKSHLPLNYGLPYMFGMQEPNDLMNPTQQELWKRTVERTLRYFEPRLLRPKVIIKNINQHRQSININITGDILIKNYPHKTQFPLSINNPY